MEQSSSYDEKTVMHQFDRKCKLALKVTRNIASEYGEYNIQCNGMGPGYIATAQTAPLREVQPDGSHHPFDQLITSKTPAGR